MKLLATLKAHDVEASAPNFDYDSFTPRTAARAIIFDADKVALIYISKHDYYMLPGGGVKNEGLVTALDREIVEEIGCNIEIKAEIGSIETYFDRWQQKQIDHCFIAHKVGESNKTSPTNFEREEGHKIVWAANISEAIKLIENAHPATRDGKLVRARDLRFLRAISQDEFHVKTMASTPPQI